MGLRRMQLFTAAGFIVAALAAASQNPGSNQVNPSPTINSSGGCDARNPSAPCHPKPYYLERKTTTVQTLANGATITTQRSETMAMDSQGRTLTTITVSLPLNDTIGHFPTHFRVKDPVENTQSQWDTPPAQKLAIVYKLPPKDQQHGCWVAESMHMNFGPLEPPSHPAVEQPVLRTLPVSTPLQPRTEDLGVETINGLEAHGTRTTSVIPVGQVGNDQPLTRSDERWVSPRVPDALREVIDDPRFGISTIEIVKLDLSDPPASTFQPPADYKLNVEELHPTPCDQY